MNSDIVTNSLMNHNLNLSEVDDSIYFAGYASVFNVIDSASDVILPGAFLGNDLSHLKLLWQHDFQKPIGMIDLAYEDEKGLFVEGKIYASLLYGKEALILIKNKIINNLSIGYEVIESYLEKDVRCITKLHLWEVSFVTFPANKYAAISELRRI